MSFEPPAPSRLDAITTLTKQAPHEILSPDAKRLELMDQYYTSMPFRPVNGDVEVVQISVPVHYEDSCYGNIPISGIDLKALRDGISAKNPVQLRRVFFAEGLFVESDLRTTVLAADVAAVGLAEFPGMPDCENCMDIVVSIYAPMI